MRRISAILITALLAFMHCESPPEEPALDAELRKELLHCVPLRQQATLERDSTGQVNIAFYTLVQDTLKNEYHEYRVRSLKPRKQVYILGYVELSDFSKAGRGIYYLDPESGPRLIEYEGAHIVKRLRRGDSPWTIADDLRNPSLVEGIKWGRLLPGQDFVIDMDVLSAAPSLGQSFDLPDRSYRIIGTEVRTIVLNGAVDIEEGQGAGEIFLHQLATLEQTEGGTAEIALVNVFEDTMEGKERWQPLRSIVPETQVSILGYEYLVPEMKSLATGLYYNDPDTGACLLDYFGARIVKRIVPGDSYWKIARDLGNVGLAGSLGHRMLHPGDTLTVNVDILEAVGWTKQSFDLPNDEYRIIGRKVPTVILRTGE